MSAIPNKFKLADRTPEIVAEYEKCGLEKIAAGEVSTLILAGG